MLAFGKHTFFQVRRLSRCMPRYLASSAFGQLLILTGRNVSLRIVNVKWMHFISLIRHVFSQCWILIKLCCKFLEVDVESVWHAKTTVSSAYVEPMLVLLVGKSAIYKRYNKVVKTLPCWTPACIGCKLVYSLLYFSRNYLSLR